MPGLALNSGLHLGLAPLPGVVGGGTPTPTPSPSAPVLSNQTARLIGDSRVANGAGYAGGSTVSCSLGTGGGFPHFWFLAAQQKLAPRSDGSYGVGATTSLNNAIRARFASIAPSTNPAQAITLRAVNADLPMSTSASGEYSFHANPGAAAFCLTSVNDGGLAYYADVTKSMDAQIALADEFFAVNTGIFYAFTPVPASSVMVDAESKSLGVGVTTFSPTNTTGFVDGEAIGVAGVKDANGNVLTKVAGAPANASEYSVSGTTYTVHASLTAGAGVTLYISYGYDTGALSGQYSHQDIMRNWMLSSAANFTYNSVDYARPGLKYGRSRIRVIDHWLQLSQSQTVGSADFYKAKHGCFDSLKVHPTPYAALLASAALATQFAADYPSLPSVYQPALGNVGWLKQGTGLTTTYSGTLPASFTNAPGFRGTTNFRIYNSNFHALLVNDGSGAFTLTMVSGTFPTGTIDLASNQTFIDAAGNYQIKTTANGTIPNSPVCRIYAEQGEGTGAGANLVPNCFFDPDAANHNGTAGTLPSTGGASPITGSGIAGWTFTITGALLTAIGNGSAVLDIQPVSIGNGVYALQVTGRGCISSNWTIIATANTNASLFNINQRVAANTRLRAYVERRLSAGPNGRMYGITHFGRLQILAGVTSANTPKQTSTGATFTGNAAGTSQTGGSAAYANPTQMSASCGDGGPTYPWDDLSVAVGGGSYVEKLISPDLNLNTDPSAPTGTITLGSITCNLTAAAGEANRPFSFRTMILLPAIRVVTI